MYVSILIIVVEYIFIIYLLEFCEKSVTYSQLRIHCSSNIQKKNVTRNLKIKGKNTFKTLDSCFPKDLFIFKEMGREEEREGEKHHQLPLDWGPAPPTLCPHPDQGRSCNVGMFPDRDSNPRHAGQG